MFTSCILIALLFNEMKKVKQKNTALLTRQFWHVVKTLKYVLENFKILNLKTGPMFTFYSTYYG